MTFKYGMRLRGFSPACQPKDGLIGAEPSDDAKYYDYLYYNRKLSEEEEKSFDLDYLGVIDR